MPGSVIPKPASLTTVLNFWLSNASSVVTTPSTSVVVGLGWPPGIVEKVVVLSQTHWPYSHFLDCNTNLYKDLGGSGLIQQLASQDLYHDSLGKLVQACEGGNKHRKELEKEIGDMMEREIGSPSNGQSDHGPEASARTGN